MITSISGTGAEVTTGLIWLLSLLMLLSMFLFSDTVPVLLMVPMAVIFTVTTRSLRALAPAVEGRSAASVFVQGKAGPAAQVQPAPANEAKVTCAGSVSATVTIVPIGSGPFPTLVTLNVNVPPGEACVRALADFTIWRSAR